MIMGEEKDGILSAASIPARDSHLGSRANEENRGGQIKSFNLRQFLFPVASTSSFRNQLI